MTIILMHMLRPEINDICQQNEKKNGGQKIIIEKVCTY